MQVTGSKNIKHNSSRLSIRIPNGQSLHCASGSIGDNITAIDLVIEGAVIVPYPSALGSKVDTRTLLNAAGVAVNDDRDVVAEGEGAVSYALRLSAESAEIVEGWRQRGLEVTLHSPLMSCVTRAIVGGRRPKIVVITILDGVIYIAYSNKKRLLYAEALPVEGEAELVNLLALLNEEHDLRKARFVLLGDESAKYYKTLRKYFRRVRVES